MSARLEGLWAGLVRFVIARRGCGGGDGALQLFPLARYCHAMTKLLDKAVDTVRRLPDPEQDDIARAMIRLASDDDEHEPVDPADLDAVLEGLAQARRGAYASDDHVSAAFRRFGK